MHQIIALVFFAVGCWAFGFCLHRSKLAKASVQWPSTKGKVVASFVEIAHREGSREEEAVFAYEFQVAGVTFLSTDLYPGWESSWSSSIPGVSSARQLVKQFPLDSTVDVYYSPQDPARSCLYPGRPAGPRVGMALSVVFCGLALALGLMT